MWNIEIAGASSLHCEDGEDVQTVRQSISTKQCQCRGGSSALRQVEYLQ